MFHMTRALQWIASAKTPTSAVALTLGSRIAILGINLGTGVIVARSLGPAGRGAAAAMALWPVVLCGLTTFGIPTALRYHTRRASADRNSLFAAALLLSFIAGLIAFVAGAVVIPHWLHAYPASVITFSVIMMLFAPQIMCYNVIQAFLEARDTFTHANWLQFAPPASTLIILLLLQKARMLSPFSVPLAYFVPTAFVTVIALFAVRQSIRLPRALIGRSRLLLGYGLRAYGLNILTTLSGQIDQAIIIGFMSAASFGLYNVALNISTILSVFAFSLNTVLFPKASGLDEETAIAVVCRSTRLVFATTVIAYLLSLLLLPITIHTVYGSAYDADVPLTRIIMLQVLLGSTTSTLAQAFMATGRPALITALQGIGVGVTFPLMLLLIPRLGLVGAAYSLLISTALRFMLLLISFPVFLQTRVPKLLLARSDVSEIRIRLSRALGA